MQRTTLAAALTVAVQFAIAISAAMAGPEPGMTPLLTYISTTWPRSGAAERIDRWYTDVRNAAIFCQRVEFEKAKDILIAEVKQDIYNLAGTNSPQGRELAQWVQQLRDWTLDCQAGNGSYGTYVGLLVGGGWSRTGVEDFNPNGSGFVGGGVFEVRRPLPSGFRIANLPGGGPLFWGAGATVLGTGIGGSDLGISSRMPFLGLFNGQFGLAGLSIYGMPTAISGVGGLAVGNVKVDAGGVSDSKTMTGWNIGAVADVTVTPNISAGIGVNYFNLGSTTLFNGTAPVSQSGTIVFGRILLNLSR